METSKNIFIIMPSNNAARTLQHTYDEIPIEYPKEIILVDDCSSDDTVEIAKRLG